MIDHCSRVVYVRDTYRYSGRGRGGFSMHYTERQCRRAVKADGLCWQHLAECGPAVREMLREILAIRSDQEP